MKHEIQTFELNTKTSPKLSNKTSNELIPKLETLKKYYLLTTELLLKILKKQYNLNIQNLYFVFHYPVTNYFILIDLNF